MSFNISRIIVVLTLIQGLAWTALAAETRPGFYNTEVEYDQPILNIIFSNNQLNADNSSTHNGITTKQTRNITIGAIGLAFASARKSSVVYTFGHHHQNTPVGNTTNTHIGLNYQLSNDMTEFGVIAENTEHPTMSDFQGLRLNASHKIEYGDGEISVYGSQSFVLNNAPHNKDGSSGSSIGLDFHFDDDRATTTLGSKYVKNKLSSYNATTGQTKVWWRDDTIFSGTTLRKFTNHRIGIGGHYKLTDDIGLSDQIDGRLIWVFDQPMWQTKSEVFWTQQKYKSDISNLYGDENTFGVSLRYIRQINENISFHLDGTISKGSRASRHPDPVNATEATSKTVAHNTVISLGIIHQF